MIKKPIDPYGFWAIDSSFRALKRSPRRGKKEKWTPVFDFIVELNESATKLVFDSLASSVLSVIPGKPVSSSQSGKPAPSSPYFPPVYEDGISRFVTLRVNVGDGALIKVQSLVEAILKNEFVVRMQMGQPRYRVFDRKGSSPKLTPKKAKVVLGIIDNACPFAHAALRDLSGMPSASRVVAHWDQSSLRKNTGTKWKLGDIFYYGAEISQTDMNALMKQHTSGGEVDEEALYAQERIYPLRKRVSHGAMVSTLMAGAKGMPAPPAWRNPDHDAGPDDAGELKDAASTAPIIAVNFPWEHIRDHAGRWMATNALDALRYIMDRADSFQRPDQPGQKSPVVVTMSYGAFAGSHDGTSLLESAIDELTSKIYEDRLAVVLPVGNHHGTQRWSDEDSQQVLTGRQPSGLHARFQLAKGGNSRLTLFVPPEKQSETSVEVWFHRLTENNLCRLTDDDDVQVSVIGPGGLEVKAKLGESSLIPQQVQEPVAGLYFYPHVAQSNMRSMALLMLAPTHIGEDSFYVPSGQWEIEISSQSAPAIQVDAYVERDDTTIGARRDQAARFVVEDAALFTDEDMFSDVATGSCTFRVGALQDVGLGAPGARVSPYSASDKAEGGPEFSALVDQGIASSGIRVSGSQSGMVVRANGTSLAAPQAARWIANELASTPSVTALRGKLPPGGTPRKGKKLLP